MEEKPKNSSKFKLREIKFNEESYPGLLIVFCGSDGSGKTTQIKKLEELIKSKKKSCVLTKQPTEMVRQSYLFDRYIHNHDGGKEIEYRALSFVTVSDRIQHSLRFIKPALENGEVVISDRYYFSAIANLRARGYKQDEWIYEVATWLPKPDLAIFLDVPYDESLKRVRARPEEAKRYIDEEFERKLNAEFSLLSDAFIDAIKINTIENSPEQVFEIIQSKMIPIFNLKDLKNG
jgi:dTMP kinase